MKSEPANHNAKDAAYLDVCLAISVPDAPTDVDIDTLKRTGPELGGISQVNRKGLVEGSKRDILGFY